MNPLGSPLDAFLKSIEAGPSMSVAVVDENGAIVASPEPALVLQTFPAAGVLTDRIRSHRAYVAEDLPPVSSADQANATMLTVMAPLRFASWGVVIQERADRAYSGLRATGLGLVLTALGLVLTGILLARTLSRSVVTPIRRLSVQASALRGGDLSRPITVSGDHEVEVLAQTLDDARVKLGTTLAELQAFNVRLEDEVVARTKVILAQDEQRKALVRRLLAATEDERRRIARELHDEIAQLLTAIQLSLHHVGVDTPEMKRAGDLLVRTHQEIHRIIHDLRPSLLDDLGLAAAIKSHAKDYLEGGRLRVNLDIPDDLPHRPEIETVIFRIYQELVTNVLRHAEAEQLSIELYERGGKLVLTVEDDGKGFDPDANSDSPGLTGMRERAAFVNGTIQFDSAPGVGTQATVEIPLR
jgi:signal transduction histidine kinase